MGNVKFQLNLNKHPKDCEDYSLVDAKNVRVSDDFSCLQTEESIIDNITINQKLNSYQGSISIVGIIPCNKELIIFVDTGFTSTDDDDATIVELLRYNEDADAIIVAYDKLKYYDGKIIGTFTYNVNNELIIAFSEYDGSKDVPLKTLNLGVWDGVNTTSAEQNFVDDKLALSPKVVIPSVSSFDYIPGNSYKGWYYYFIRYKINKTDYTKWYPLGYPIFIDTIELKNIFKYGLNGGTRNGSTIIDNFYLNGISDHFSSKDDVANESVSLNIENIDINYDYFQIGFVCVSKTYSKGFRTSDINVNQNYIYSMNISNCIEYSVNDLITENYNYYNVKNVINYKNRLYISNYKELKTPEISQEDLNKIKLSISKTKKDLFDIKLRTIDSDIETNIENSSDGENEDYISAYPTLYNFGVILRQNEFFEYITDNIDFKYTYIKTNDDIKIYPSTVVKTNIGANQYKFQLGFEINGIIYTAEFTSQRITTQFGYEYKFTVTASDFTAQIPIYKVFKYINTNNSFNDRKKESTLLPGEIYSFYIHFVDKYGESTIGYKLQNNAKFKLLNSDVEYFPIPFYNSYLNITEYLLVPLNQNVFDENHNLITNGLVVGTYNHVETSNSYFFTQSATDIYTGITALDILSFNTDIPDLKWYDLYYTSIDTVWPPFSIYINSNGDKLFKVPNHNDAYSEVSSNYSFNTYIYSLNFNLNDFELPEGYIGYYFSYEKFESTKKIDGILTKVDIFNQDSIPNEYINNNQSNINNLNHINFYSGSLDIDSANVDYNCLRIYNNRFVINTDTTRLYISKDKNLLLAKYPINYNQMERPTNTDIKIANTEFINIAISNIKLKYANNIADGTLNVGTVLEIPLDNVLNNLLLNNTYYRASLLKINKNIYTNENKVLIKFTNIYYKGVTNGTVNKGLNGHITYQGTLIYNYNRFILSAENVILTEQFKPYYPCPVYEGLNDRYIGDVRPPISYIQQLCFNDSFYESKSFKNEPKVVTQNLELPTTKANDIVPFAINNIIAPLDSIDLFQELQTNQDKLNPKTYLAQSDSREYISQFDKRIRRSNVIADESLNNSWRIFPLEGYKDISENKGKITNLIGVGTTLLAHTEHSLFAFDGSNTLKTGDDNDVRLVLPDVFDIEYFEVFTSDMGVCGLQDKEAWVVGQFGYIFYDNDAHRFYKYASKKIEIIDFDIIQFLNIKIPYNVRFAQDKERNRLLITFTVFNKFYNILQEDTTQFTISYNYQLNRFISFHDYTFTKGVNTKNILYLVYKNKIYCNIYDLEHPTIVVTTKHKSQRRKYSSSDNQYGYYMGNAASNSPMVSIIVNSSYSLMKTIEFLIYKLFKRINSTDDVLNSTDSREQKKVPYSGYKLRIHNDLCDSDLIDVSIDTESSKNAFNNYKKPWWEFGNWNFNYFRDTKQGTSSHDIMSRIYGNYFIIDIIFYDTNNPYPQKIEFENLDVKLIADATV